MICPACKEDSPDDSENCFRCGAPFPTVVRRGDVVGGRYEIRDRLGRGGMGAVYRAHDVVLGEDIALKLLRPDVGQSAELSRRFRSEIKLARKITHPNVCRIHDYGEGEDRQFISMELVDGVDLRRHMRERRPMPREEAYDIAIQLAKGLEAVHAMGIVHRDLKPQNAMRDKAGRIRLMDFGIAKRVHGEVTTAVTAEGTILGTPEYMSPEQARGQETDFRSDIYSLGIVVFELFAGRVPFVGSTPVATLLQHVEASPPLDQPVAAPIPSRLRPVLARALAKDPAERYQTVAGLLSAIETTRADVEPESATRAESGLVAASDDSVATLAQAGAVPGPRAVRHTLLVAAGGMAGVVLVFWGVMRLTATTDLPAPAGAVQPAPSGLAVPIGDDEEAIRQLLGAYAWMLRSKDIAGFERLKGSLSPEQRQALAASFKAIRSQRVSMTIESVKIAGDKATAIVTRRDTINDRLMRPIQQMFTLSRNGSAWRIDEIGLPPDAETLGAAPMSPAPAKP